MLRKSFQAVGDELNRHNFRNRKDMAVNKRRLRVTTKRQSAKKYDLTVQNVVFTASLGVRVPLAEIADKLYGTLGKKTFPAVICRLVYPEAVVSIFESGKIILTGCRHPRDALVLVWMISMRLYFSLGIRCIPNNLTIQNVNCSVSIGYGVDVELFFDDNMSACSYAPDKFPGLNFPVNNARLKEMFFGCTFLLFKSGRMVVTGARTPRDAHRAFNVLVARLPAYATGSTYRHLSDDQRRLISRVRPEQE